MGLQVGLERFAAIQSRATRTIREREILRIVAHMSGEDPAKIMSLAQREVVAWAQNRAGGKLPSSAWDGQGFDYLAGGRTTMGARIRNRGADLWALRADDPDKYIPGRVWTTEVAIGCSDGEEPVMSLRLLVSTSEAELQINPHAPGVVQQLAKSCRLWAGGLKIEASPWQIRTEDEVHTLVELLEDPQRRLPFLIASGDERQVDQTAALLDVDRLSRAMIGLAKVVVVPAQLTYALSDAVGKARSVFHGAMRIYFPQFDAASNPYDHPLFLGGSILEDPDGTEKQLRQLIARDSLRRSRLGHDVLPFTAVRSSALRFEQERRASEGASDSEQLEAARQRIEALEKEIESATSQAESGLQTATEEEERARVAEAQLHAARELIRTLKQKLISGGIEPHSATSFPEKWDDFADWCDSVFPGDLALAPAARRGLRKPEFENVGLVARCILWLATECLDRRMNGGGNLSNISIHDGIENAPCGSDTFEFNFQGRRLMADWHIKSGGNTRDPKRCLRIYYTFDPVSLQIVVAELPAHRRTGAS